ncbi:uncharacterized protein FA14DRAFT_3936 [Meira miltonrushii]|uniref:Uncharacterized protein n=1 Tax=Meira miltonrushii TaxID=1280837 RepID=A0A316VG05_9BASI|nr:uncharacterized protein FA14DRAFT_3936 [Meira miltonrushii]PWN36549.1 hypothetical protein FA14DRAFT_3936 [Meira miltonrushii]
MPVKEPLSVILDHAEKLFPHFRPPSPSAASVLSVAVQPPASPKLQASAGSGLASVGSTSVGSALAEVVDSGEETESFDNGALTPTLSDEFPEDDTEERLKLPSDPFYAGNAKSGPSFNLQRMNIDSDDAPPSTSSGGPYQVSFNPVVTSHHRGSVSGFSGRAPSIAATAGSSRAPSTRGLSPPASMSRAGTTEGSSVEEYESTGTGLDGDGAETPSVGRSRRSSYSAPSSEVDNGGMINDDVNNRARGGTLVPSMHATGSNANLHVNQGQSDLGEDGGPSLAPSEAGSDSTRSMTYESSIGHGGANSHNVSAYGGVPIGHATASSERLPLAWASAGIAAASSSPLVVEPPSITNDLTEAGISPSPSGFKGSSTTPMLPSLLAIKRASRRQDSGPASTAATAGTTSPASSLSVDGDFDEPPGGYPSENV